jgi:curved DNA-binding protein CbpA
VSINCHGFRYFSRERPQKGASITFQISVKEKDNSAPAPAYPARVAWTRKSRRLDGLYLVGVEFGIALNIWDVDEVPEDWAAYSPSTEKEPASFLADVDRILDSVRTATYYQLLGVESSTSRSEVKRHFYQLARRFHPDHHMDHPEWTPRLLALMDGLTTAYKTLSDEETRKEYDSLLARGSGEKPSDSQKLTQGFLEKAQECMAEKNFAGCILWLHRAIESEPDSSSHRTMLGRCLSAIPEYRREAVEQFEIAIELDPRNLSAHFHFAELLEQLKVPWRAQFHYLRVLELDVNHREARERLNRLGASAPRASSRPSLLARLTGRR